MKDVDYASHLVENERLRAHFGHSEASSEQGQGVGEDGRTMGKWWISWPMAEEGGRSRDVYGGLM